MSAVLMGRAKCARCAEEVDERDNPAELAMSMFKEIKTMKDLLLAVSLATEAKKRMFLVIHGTWCGACTNFKTNAYNKYLAHLSDDCPERAHMHALDVDLLDPAGGEDEGGEGGGIPAHAALEHLNLPAEEMVENVGVPMSVLRFPGDLGVRSARGSNNVLRLLGIYLGKEPIPKEWLEALRKP
jgi:hypothetical protein